MKTNSLNVVAAWSRWSRECYIVIYVASWLKLLLSALERLTLVASTTKCSIRAQTWRLKTDRNKRLFPFRRILNKINLPVSD